MGGAPSCWLHSAWMQLCVRPVHPRILSSTPASFDAKLVPLAAQSSDDHRRVEEGRALAQIPGLVWLPGWGPSAWPLPSPCSQVPSRLQKMMGLPLGLQCVFLTEGSWGFSHGSVWGAVGVDGGVTGGDCQCPWLLGGP